MRKRSTQPIQAPHNHAITRIQIIEQARQFRSFYLGTGDLVAVDDLTASRRQRVMLKIKSLIVGADS